MDDFMKVLLTAAVIFGVGLIILLVGFVGPALNEKGEQHGACIEKGGIWVDESRACMDPKGLMK